MTASRLYYDPLPAPNNIRLLEIHPGDSNEAISCNLVTKSLDAELTYVALSYTWGVDGERFDITCNGRQVRITKHLHSALRRLRLPRSTDRPGGSKPWSKLGKVLGRLRSKPQKVPSRMIIGGRQIDPTGDVSEVLAHFPPGSLYFWTDAICIDQENPAEKSVQVGLMRRIYRQATLVIADLGELTENTRYALETMPGWKDPLGVRMAKMKDSVVDPAREKVLAGFTELFLQPWFLRTWVFQEVVLGREVALLWDHNLNPVKVLHGVGVAILELDTDLRYGERLTDSYRTEKDKSARAFANFKKMVFWNHMFDHGWRPKMLDILQTQMDAGATDARDKIYAYLGVAREFAACDFQVDYTESTSRTYYRFACHMLVQEKQVTLLHLVTGRPSRYNLPSWVPDFSSRSILQPIGLGEPAEDGKRLETQAIYKAGGTQHPHFHVLQQFRELRISGFFYDMIAHVGYPWRTSQYLDGPEWTKLVLFFIAGEALDMVDQHCTKTDGNELALLHACCRTLICYTTNGVNKLGQKDVDRMQKAFLHLKAGVLDNVIESIKKRGRTWDDRSEDPDDPQILIDIDLETARPFLAALDVVSAERRFAITKRGHPAYVPATAVVGDSICVFRGVPTPFVIKRHKIGDSLIGEAYVHGIMGGEALLLGRPFEDIVLR